MTIIDHRILIPQSPDKIWFVISDLTRNSIWQTDCSSVSVLTSKRTGPNVRWRYTTLNGREYVMETTAWYDGLGYEYKYVDGALFRQSQGRIRLQEIAEGTIVQWTLNYEVGGMFGGVRNIVGFKRHLEDVMIDSLRKLWTVVKESGFDNKLREAKSLMRDAPDYEARNQYKSRFASTTPEAVSEAEKLLEPSIVEEDTRPHAVGDEPEFLSRVDVSARKPEPQRAKDTLSSVRQSDRSGVKRPDEDTQPTQLQLSESEVVLEQRVSTDKSEGSELPNAALIKEQDTSTLDTAEISVFDLFGVPRPSQTRQLQTIITPQKQQQIGRTGLRIVSRHRQVRVRRTGVI
jgi:hypothetical protein